MFRARFSLFRSFPDNPFLDFRAPRRPAQDEAFASAFRDFSNPDDAAECIEFAAIKQESNIVWMSMGPSRIGWVHVPVMRIERPVRVQVLGEIAWPEPVSRAIAERQEQWGVGRWHLGRMVVIGKWEVHLGDSTGESSCYDGRRKGRYRLPAAPHHARLPITCIQCARTLLRNYNLAPQERHRLTELVKLSLHDYKFRMKRHDAGLFAEFLLPEHEGAYVRQRLGYGPTLDEIVDDKVQAVVLCRTLDDLFVYRPGN